MSGRHAFPKQTGPLSCACPTTGATTVGCFGLSKHRPLIYANVALTDNALFSPRRPIPSSCSRARLVRYRMDNIVGRKAHATGIRRWWSGDPELLSPTVPKIGANSVLGPHFQYRGYYHLNYIFSSAHMPNYTFWPTWRELHRERCWGESTVDTTAWIQSCW